MRLNSYQPCTVAAHVQSDCRIRACSGVRMDVCKRVWISPHRIFQCIEVQDAHDEIKKVRARFCCSWLVRRAVPIKCTSDLRRNQRSASNPVPSPSHKQHLNENIHGHLQREESDEGVPTWASHCFQLARQWRVEQIETWKWS